MSSLDYYPKPAKPTGIPGLFDAAPLSENPIMAQHQQAAQDFKVQQQKANAFEEDRRTIPGLTDEMMVKQGIDPTGMDNPTRVKQYATARAAELAQKPPTTGIITEKDVADAGIDPRSIPQEQWPAAVAKAKSGREGKMTEMQSNALQYSARMAYNRDILDKLEATAFNPASIGAGLQNLAPNLLRSPEVQTYRAARDNWISAVLRKESGAAISKSEYENAYKQYFPQVGDAPQIIQQKKNLRKIAEDNMKLVAGGRAAEAETGITPPGAGTQPAPAAPPAAQAQPAAKTGTEIIERNGKRYEVNHDTRAVREL